MPYTKAPQQDAAATNRRANMAFDQAKADIICQRLAEGESLRAICRDSGMPKAPTVILWVNTNSEFAEQYARAREIGYLRLADEIVDIADEVSFEPVQGLDGETKEVRVDSTAVARNRLRVDTRKWMLSKMLPKIYGDKLDLNHSGAVKFERIESVIVDPKG